MLFFTGDKSYLGECVRVCLCVCEPDRQTEVDGCVPVQRRTNSAEFSQSPSSTSPFSTRCSTFSVFRGSERTFLLHVFMCRQTMER